MFLRKDHPKFMKKRQIANSNKKGRKHEKHITKELIFDVVDKRARAFDVKKSRFNKSIYIALHEPSILFARKFWSFWIVFI